MKKAWIRGAALLCFASASASALALPSFARIVSGEATFEWRTDTLTVATTGDTAIEWSTFNVGANDRVYFRQSTDSNTVWNTVLDLAPARILGSIESNGGLSFAGAAFAFGGSITAKRVAIGAPASLVATEVLGGITLRPSGGQLQLHSGPVQPSGGQLQLRGGSLVLTGGGQQVPSGSGQIVVSNVPEPETYALLLAGLGLLGVVSRNRRRQSDCA